MGGDSCASLRAALGGIGAVHRPLALRGSFGSRTPSSVRTAVDGMPDPMVGAWARVGTALESHNTAHSEEAQGAPTDGEIW